MRSFGSLALGSYRLCARLRDKLFSVAVRGAFAEFGARSVIQLPVRISGETRIAIGDDVFVGAGSWLQVIDPSGTDAAITVGSGTSISGGCVLSAVRSVRLGERVLMARNVYIADHSHRYADTRQAIRDQGTEKVAGVEIGD